MSKSTQNVQKKQFPVISLDFLDVNNKLAVESNDRWF